jgi:endoglucanase
MCILFLRPFLLDKLFKSKKGREQVNAAVRCKQSGSKHARLLATLTVSTLTAILSACSDSPATPVSSEEPRSGTYSNSFAIRGACGIGLPDSLVYTGINIAGAEFGEDNMPGVYGQHYIYPDNSYTNQFTRDIGMNTIRLPFRWERVQRTLFGELDSDELARLKLYVENANASQTTVLLDIHNYARYAERYIGEPGSDVSAAAFADLWRRLATEFKSNANVIFSLMNEPAEMPTELWVDGAQQAIDAIRQVEANQLILVDGNYWSGAHSWYNDFDGQGSNAEAMLNLVDPCNNMAFDAHQYLDSDSSGTSGQCDSSTVGAERLSIFTRWLKENNRKGFIGEFGASNDPQCLEALDGMLSHMQSNSDVYIGWTYWAGGPWWDNSFFVIRPETGEGSEQLAVLRRYLADSTDDDTDDGTDDDTDDDTDDGTDDETDDENHSDDYDDGYNTGYADGYNDVIENGDACGAEKQLKEHRANDVFFDILRLRASEKLLD